jgi:hypothetical protein
MGSIRRGIEKLESGWSQAAEGGIHLFVQRVGMELAPWKPLCGDLAPAWLLGVSERTIKRDRAMAKAWLYGELQSRD